MRLVLLLSTMGMGGCSTGCIASHQKLARLAPGMSYDDVAAAMGCQGRLVRGSPDARNTYAMAEWPGPRSLLRQTDMLFFDRRLLWYDSQPAPGF